MLLSFLWCVTSGIVVAPSAVAPEVCALDAAHNLHRIGEHRAAIEAFECALPRAEHAGRPVSLGNRMTYARSLKKVGAFDRALAELDRVESIVASDAALAARPIVAWVSFSPAYPELNLTESFSVSTAYVRIRVLFPLLKWAACVSLDKPPQLACPWKRRAEMSASP